MMTDSNAASPFGAFLRGWMIRQKDYHEELISARRRFHELHDGYLRELISRVLSHYEQYYEEKSRIAQQNIFLLFSPPWFSSLEKTFLWIAGFKPGMAFRLVNSSLHDLSEEQKEGIRQLQQETKVEERALNDELAKIQESVAAPPVVEMARRVGRSWLTEGAQRADEVPSTLRNALEALVANADALRTNTVLRMMRVLKPAQAINFLVAIAELQLKIRQSGLQKDAESARKEGTVGC